MINRKEFVKNCAAAVCATGLCCATKAPGAQAADDALQACDPKELTAVKDKADAAHLRFSKLIEIIEAKLPEGERKQILHALGGKCADTFRASLIDRYKGNIKGFLEEGRRNWMAEADYDEAKGTIRIVDKGPSCSCPMVKVGTTPGSFCDCTLGWQEQTYSEILGRPVKAELEESILRGGKRCVYRIKIV
jgi:predicted hydrocarbon binding protein